MIDNYEKYIFFSDLHSNYHALKSFYNYLESLEKKTKVFFLGDLIGYYKFDSRILDIFEKMLTDYQLSLILGNHDAKFLNQYYGMSYEINCQIPINEENLNDTGIRNRIRGILLQAEKTREISIFDRNTILSHGGIWDPLNAYCYPDLMFLKRNNYQYTQSTNYIFGHSHYSFIFRDIENDTNIINIGSIGMPRDNSVYGNVLEIDSASLEMKTIEYNLDMQFESNINLQNDIRNRVFFGGNSSSLNRDLLCFDSKDKEIIKMLKTTKTIFSRMILFRNNVKIVKTNDCYLLLINRNEKKYENLKTLIKELGYGI